MSNINTDSSNVKSLTSTANFFGIYSLRGIQIINSNDVSFNLVFR
jgi:hypothetical protein